jgi:hydroxymethylglutaryl-CoA reductase
MDEYFAAMPMTNATKLCVGGITRSETERACDDGIGVDGRGYYLFLANEADPRQPIRILAKFVSDLEAGRFARLLEAQLNADSVG